MGIKDHYYQQFFSHPAMVQALFQGIIDGPWAQRLDLDSIEPLSTRYHTDKQRKREGDMVWRIPWRKKAVKKVAKKVE